MKRIVAVFPHPDDESFAAGGTIAKYAKAGWRITLICATRGQEGQGGHFSLSGEKLGEIRTQELVKAGAILDIEKLIILEYKDGTLPQVPFGELEDMLFRKFTELVPDIIITYEPGGISNHPDHIRLSKAVTYAYQKYAESLEDLSDFEGLKGRRIRDLNRLYRKSFDEVQNVNRSLKLYFTCLPKSIGDYLIKQKRLPALSFGKPWSVIADDSVTTVIDIKKFKSQKVKALEAHETQREDVCRFTADKTHNMLLSQEYFILRMIGLTEVYMGKKDRVATKL